MDYTISYTVLVKSRVTAAVDIIRIATERKRKMQVITKKKSG